MEAMGTQQTPIRAGDYVRIMQTREMEVRGLANKRFHVTTVQGGHAFGVIDGRNVMIHIATLMHADRDSHRPQDTNTPQT